MRTSDKIWLIQKNIIVKKCVAEHHYFENNTVFLI